VSEQLISVSIPPFPLLGEEVNSIEHGNLHDSYYLTFVTKLLEAIPRGNPYEVMILHMRYASGERLTNKDQVLWIDYDPDFFAKFSGGAFFRGFSIFTTTAWAFPVYWQRFVWFADESGGVTRTNSQDNGGMIDFIDCKSLAHKAPPFCLKIYY